MSGTPELGIQERELSGPERLCINSRGFNVKAWGVGKSSQGGRDCVETEDK